MGLVSVGLRTAQSLLHVAAGAGRLRALAPPTHGSAGPWWLPAGGQVWMNVISFFVTGKVDLDNPYLAPFVVHASSCILQWQYRTAHSSTYSY